MSPAEIAILAIANIAGAASPGPDVLLVLRQASRSRAHALASTAGIQTGAFLWITLTVFAGAAILTTFPGVLDAVQIVGGLWLLWMACNLVRAGWAMRYQPPIDIVDAGKSLGTLSHAYRLGLSTNLANPKIVLFLSSITVPLLPHSPSLLTQLVAIAVLCASSIAVFVSLSLIVSTRAIRQRLLGASGWIDVGSGVLFLGFGSLLLVRGILAAV